MEISAFMDGNEVIEGLQDRIRGRWSAYDIIHPETGEIIVPADTMITVDQAEAVEKAGIKKVWIRTVLTCVPRLVSVRSATAQTWHPADMYALANL